jgi:hypothetical protein
MIDCKICNTVFNNINGLAKHLTATHKIDKKIYYDKYIGKTSSTCVCGKEKKFRTLGEGYRQFCSPQCRSNNIPTTKYWEGKKQPQSMIDKRRDSMVEKYGVANGYLTKHSVAKKYKGFVCRSKYEKMFVDFAEIYGYKLSVPERIAYELEGRSRYYYPDFYLDDLDLIVEVKSDWTWKQQLDMNIAKMVCTIEQGYDIIFIDEEHGINDEKLWDELNEYLCSFKRSN